MHPIEWHNLSEAEERRYWSQVGEPDPVTGCMPHLRPIHRGYGRLGVTREGREVRLIAHRVAYVLSGRQLENGMVVDHICLNPACQNHKHLRGVTHAQNMQHRAGACARSGARGVYPDRGRWRAQVRVNWRIVSVGTFSTIEEATAAATAARLELMPYAHPDLRGEVSA